MNATLEEDDSDDDDFHGENEETALEVYTTPLDEDTCEIDEYVVFKQVLQSKYYRFHLNGVQHSAG